MSHMNDSLNGRPAARTSDPSGTGAPTARSEEPVGVLVSRATEQMSQLVREEMRLAQAEMKQKGQRLGMGGGMFGGAGLFGFLALQAMVATGIVALALVLPWWASALIVTGVLLLIAGVLALMGKKQVKQGVPPTPERAVAGVKADVETVKERAHR